MEETRRESKETIRLWRVWQTARQMCFDRGYELSEDELTIPLEDFKAQFCNHNGDPDRSKMSFSARPTADMIAKYTDPPTNKNPEPLPQIGTIWVEFSGEGAIGTKELRNYMHHLHEHKFYTGIFVSKEPITSMGTRFLQGETQFKPPGGVETFNEQDLLVNITKHELVPKHVVLSKAEKIALLERYRLKETQLPRIQVTDPVAKYLGLRRGQVVKIIRKSETAGRYASYRWCI